jgi:hypothetical protein
MKLPLLAMSMCLLGACASVDSKYVPWGTYPISVKSTSAVSDAASSNVASTDAASTDAASTDAASTEAASTAGAPNADASDAVVHVDPSASDDASSQNSSSSGTPTAAEANKALYGSPPQGTYGVQGPPRRRPDMDWQKGEVLMQGFFGWTDYSKVSVNDGIGDHVDGDNGDVDSMPFIGGGAQYKMGGDRISLGLEGMFSFGGRANAAAVAVGGGGAVVAVDVDLFVFDMYGGPFISIPLGDKMRVYGAVGPLLQWGDYDQHGNNLHANGSGFGTGWYARTGFEFEVGSRTYLGFGARWSDSSIDLSGTPHDLDLEGLEYMITVSTGI